jgi:hypothetical protein
MSCERGHRVDARPMQTEHFVIVVRRCVDCNLFIDCKTHTKEEIFKAQQEMQKRQQGEPGQFIDTEA